MGTDYGNIETHSEHGLRAVWWFDHGDTVQIEESQRVHGPFVGPPLLRSVDVSVNLTKAEAKALILALAPIVNVAAFDQDAPIHNTPDANGSTKGLAVPDAVRKDHRKAMRASVDGAMGES